MLGSAEKKIQERATTGDVLEEQIDYLIAHSKTGCAGCEDCRRFQDVVAVLMQPFREDTCKTKT